MTTERIRLMSMLRPTDRRQHAASLAGRVGRRVMPLALMVLLAGCSSVERTWDSVFSSSDPAPTSSASASPAGKAAAANTPVALPETDGLTAAANRPGYVAGKTRRDPNTVRGLVEDRPKPKAEVQPRSPDPAPAPEPAAAAPAASVPAPVAAASAPEPVAVPVSEPVAAPTPLMAEVPAQPVPARPLPTMAGGMLGGAEETVVIGGDGVSYTPSQAALPIEEPGGDDLLSVFDPSNGQLVATIQFANGSSGLSALDRQIIGQVAALQRQHNTRVRVIGHASSRTGDMDIARHQAVNLEISTRRAMAVAEALVGAGVPRARIITAAAAASDPIYQENMPAGEAGNRRAEIYLEH